MSKQRLSRVQLVRRPAVERRARPRTTVALAGTATYEQESFSMRVRDLGERGGRVVVASDHRFRPSGRLLLTLDRPGGAMRIRGVIRHARPTELAGERAWEMGVEFRSVTRAKSMSMSNLDKI